MKTDFPRIAAQLLARAEELVPRWLPAGKRRGHEWVCGNLRGDAGDSCSVNLATGKWADFAQGDGPDSRGGDLISLYAAIHGISQAEAAHDLAPEDAPTDRSAARSTTPTAAAPSLSADAEASGQSASVPEAHPALPPPTAAPIDAALPNPPGMVGRWLYFLPPERGPVKCGPIYVVCRIAEEGGKKSFRQFTWRQVTGQRGKWLAKGYPDERPLYHLPELLESPHARVLVVEGEKAAEAAYAALEQYANEEWVAITWAGGAQAARKTDWSPLKGRGTSEAPVIIWPDADIPGRKAAAEVAAILLALEVPVAVVPTDGRPEGFDAADAVPTEIPDIVATAGSVRRSSGTAEPGRLSRARPSPPQGAVIESNGRVLTDGSAFVLWQQLGLKCNGNGQPFPTLGNAHLIVASHPQLQGKIWLDSFRGRIYHAMHGVPEPWTDAEALRLTAWFNQVLEMPKVGVETIHRAVELTAVNNVRNSVTEWLESLAWDGTPRLTSWLADCLGVARTAFTMAVARNWLISMVARAYRPGCQADHMPVLEGNSGAGKSSTLAILGGEWYRAAPQAFGSKAFLEVIQGAWLVEIPDMVGFGRTEHAQIISAITTRSDSYRASYGRNAEEHPRTAIFAATSETDEYLQDSRGRRRYWPLRCTEIDLKALAGMRDQLFAEACDDYRKGSSWYEVPREEAEREQSEREQADPWLDRICHYADRRDFVTVAEIATGVLEIPLDRQGQSEANRISKCLKKLGYIGKLERDGQWVGRRYRKGVRA